MPPSLDPGDRKLLYVAGAIMVLLIAATFLITPPPEDSERTASVSTYSTGAGGAQAAFLLLHDLGYRSERWDKPPTELPEDEADGNILILARPEVVPSPGERADLLRFVRAGGWIVYVGDHPYLFLHDGRVAPPSILTSPALASDRFSAVSPSRFTAAAPQITLDAENRWATLEGAQVPLYGEPDEPVVVTWPLGKGRILWWAAPTPVTNAGIAREGNLPFFMGVVRALRPGASPRETTILWDEYFHGYRGSLWGYFAKTPVPWAILQMALVAAFVLLAFARRSGPLFAPAAPARLSPLEFVDTLGALYERANAGSAAVSVAYRHFRSQLVRRLALAPATPNVQLESAVRERLGWKQPGLAETLSRSERAARDPELPARDALDIVQALEHYSVLLGLKTRSDEEKH